MLSLVPNQWQVATLLASDFPSENPRTQSRTFHIRAVVSNSPASIKTFNSNVFALKERTIAWSIIVDYRR